MEASQNIRVRGRRSDLECNGSGPRLYGDFHLFFGQDFTPSAFPLLARRGNISGAVGAFLWVFLPCRCRSGTQRPFLLKNRQTSSQTLNPCKYVPEWTRNATDEFLLNEWQ